jgi:glucose/mannose transport system permease protein
MRPPVAPFSWERVALYFCLSTFLVFFLSPLYVMLMTSFKSLDEIRESNMLLPPQAWFFGGWAKAWDHACVGLSCNGVKPHFMATFAITIPGLILAVLVGALNGYALTQWKFRGSDLLLGGLLMGCFMPFQLYLIPIAITLRELGIFGTSFGLILLHTVYGVPLATLLFRNYFVTLPPELIKAAVIDGAGFFRIFFYIILPMSTSIIMVAVILIFTGIYNDFIFALTFGEVGKQPVMAALNNIVNSTYGVKEHNVNMAATLLTALPTLFIYLVAGKFFIRGLTSGAVKG